jgi:hypothetical protein
VAADEPPPVKGAGEYAKVTITSSGKSGEHIRAGAVFALIGEDFKGVVADRLGFAGKKGRFTVVMARVEVGGTQVSVHWVVDRAEKLDQVVVDHPSPTQRGKKITIDGAAYFTEYLVDQGEIKGIVAEGELYAPAKPRGLAANPLEGLAVPALFSPKHQVRLHEPGKKGDPPPGFATAEGMVVAGDFRYDGDHKSVLAIRNGSHPIVLVPGAAKDLPGKGRVRATGQLRVTDAGQAWLIVDEVSALPK